MLGRRDNRYITAPELAQVAFLSCFAHLEFFFISAFVENFGKTSHVLNNFRHMLANFSWN